MTSIAADSSSPVLLTVVQTLLVAQGLNDVRSAIAHGARVLSPYETLSLYETQDNGELELTLRSGAELGPGSLAIEGLLCDKAIARGGPVSTLELPRSEGERLLVDEYLSRRRACVVRTLHAYEEFIGAVVLHYADRQALPQVEFDALRRLADFAALALSIARTRAELNNIAYTDILTGLANRRWLDVEFARLQGTEVAVLLIDFDGLKAVNDSLGFDRGDALIRTVGATLASAANGDEFVVRYGGDEFVLVMPRAGRPRAMSRAEELTAILDGLGLPEDLAPLFQGASVGAAIAEPGENLWEVLQRASAEMRSRKRRRKTDREFARNGEDEQSRPGYLLDG